MSEKMLFINRWKAAGAFVRPSGISPDYHPLEGSVLGSEHSFPFVTSDEQGFEKPQGFQSRV